MPGRPTEWIFAIEFEDEDHPQYYKLPDQDVRIYVPIADVIEVLR